MTGQLYAMTTRVTVAIGQPNGGLTAGDLLVQTDATQPSSLEQPSFAACRCHYYTVKRTGR